MVLKIHANSKQDNEMVELRECDARPLSWASHGTRLGRARPTQHRRNGARQDFYIEPERPFVHVLQVQPHPLLQRNRASAVDLPKTGDAGTNAEAPSLPIFIETLVVAHRKRTRTYEAHVTLQYVEELRQFVNAAAAQHLSERCNAWIVHNFKYGPGNLILVFQHRDQFFGVGNHRAEFVNRKCSFVDAKTFLAEKDRTP